MYGYISSNIIRECGYTRFARSATIIASLVYAKLLSDLNVTNVSGVVSRIEQSESHMESILASRLHIGDIPVLAKVLSGQKFSKCWKRLVYSLPLSKGNISRFPPRGSYKELEEQLAKWPSKVPDRATESLRTILCQCKDIIKMKESRSPSPQMHHIRRAPLLGGRVRNDDDLALEYAPLSSLLKEYFAILMKYANYLLLPQAQAKLLTNAICTMTREECLNTVLTMWVKNEFHHARLPMLTNLVDVLSEHEEAKLVQCLMFYGTNCQRFENSFKIESVWPSSDLDVTEGRSALLEIQTSCAVDSSVAFDWWLENAGVMTSYSLARTMITNRFHYLSVAIVHVDVNSLEMEGTYKCKVTHKTKSQINQHTVTTPLDELTAFQATRPDHFHLAGNQYRWFRELTDSEQPEIPECTWPSVAHNTNNEESQTIQLTVKTPLDELTAFQATRADHFHSAGNRGRHRWCRERTDSEQPEILKYTRPSVCMDSYINLAHKTNNEESQAIQLTVQTPLDEYRNKVTSFHLEQPEIPEDTWPPVNVDSYINLALIKQARITAPSYHTIRGDADDILSDKEAIMYKVVFDHLDSGTRLLLEGRPGSGKTTLVHKASKDWASGDLKFPHNRLLFLVHLRAFSSNPDVGLHDIIKCYSYPDSTVSTISEYAERHDGLGLCFILDGLDEYMPGNDSCFIFRLIRREILPKAVVITASRPAAAANFRRFASKHVEVIGFLTQEIYEYVAKYPFSTFPKCNQLCQYLDQHPRVLHTCYLPIHSAMVCFLFNELEDDLPQTETEVYGEFTKYMILRTLYREGESRDTCIESLDDLAPPQKEIFYKICRLAYEMTKLSKQVTKQTEIKSFFNVEESLGILTVDRTATRLGFQKMYTFLHLTAQEYLAAYYISKLDEKEQLEVIKEYGGQNQMQQVWKFFCGLAQNVDNWQHKLEILLGHSKYGTLYKVQCCYESQLSHFCDTAIDDSSLCFEENFLSSSNFEEVAYVLSNTKHNSVKKLFFDGCIFGKDEVSVLLKKSDNKKLASVTTLCYPQCSREQWDVVKYFVHSLASLEVLDLSQSHLQGEEILHFLEKLNHPNLKRIQTGSVGCVLHPVRDLNLMLVEESTDHPYHIVPFSISANELLPVKFLSRELILHPETFSSIDVLKNVFSASNLECIRKLLSQCTNLTSFCFSHNYVGASVLPETCSTLQRLDVSFNCLGNKGAEAIANTLKQCSLLLELNIASNHIGSAGAKALAEGLKTCTKLEKLVLHSNDIRTEGVQALAKSMEQWTNFTSLDVSSNFLTSEAAKFLAIGLMNCPSHTFQEMYIGNNAIGDSGLESLASALKKCTTLDISSNSISATGLEAIADNFVSIQQLDISGNTLDGINLAVVLAQCTCLSKLTIGQITGSGKKSLQLLNVTDVIIKNTLSLLSLDISRSTQDYEALATTLKHCNQLHEINVSHTPLGMSIYGLAALSSSLSCLSQLTTLSLSFIQIEEETKLLANGLISCTNLRKLFIDNNNIGDVGAEAIATIIEKCHQLQVLDVSNNNIGDFGARWLAAALERSGNLCEFNISHNDIQSGGEKLLCEALEHCVNISSLNFSKSSLEHLPQSLKKFTCLRMLQISHNLVNTEHLSKGLKCCKCLQELYISSCRIISPGVTEIASSLSRTCCVLDISGNKIDSLTDVLSNLQDHSSLSHFDFSKNPPLFSCERSFKFLKCTKLQTFIVSEISLSDGKLSLIADSLQCCTILQHLCIARNRISIHGLKALARVLKYFPMLQTLDVSGNNIGDEGAEILADSLQNNSILTTLGVYACGITESGIQILDMALNSNTGRVRTRIVHIHCLPPPVFESNTFL